MSIADNFTLFLTAELFNALSLILFNGAFTAYLIDNNPEENISDVLSYYAKYNYICMALFSFLGSIFVTIESSSIWFFSSALMLLCMFTAFRSLPKDNQKKDIDYTGTSIVKNMKKDFIYVINFLKNNGNKKIKNIFIQYILVLLLMQIIIQYWQPYTFGYEPKITHGIFYGLFFSFLLIVQSLASHVYNNIYAHKIKFNTNLFIIAIVISLLANIFSQQILLIISISLLFFHTQFNSLDRGSQFHKSITSDLRATFDAIASSIYRLLLIIILPVFTFLTSYFGWITIPVLYIIYAIISFYAQKRFFSYDRTINI